MVETATFDSAVNDIKSDISNLSSQVATLQSGITVLTDALNNLQQPNQLQKIDMTFMDSSGNSQVITLNVTTQ